MEQFCGTWKFKGEIENLDNFLKAVNLTDKKAAFTMEYIYEVTGSNEVLTFTTKAEGQDPYTATAELGKKVNFEMPGRGPVEAYTVMEGNTIVVNQDISGLKQVMRSHIENGRLIINTTANGATMTAFLHKM